MKYADLHLHTIYSDGTLTPKELVDTAKKSGLACISVTDHDTIEAIELANQEAASIGLENIPGIEITSEEDQAEIHILGYLIDYKNKPLLKMLEKIAAARVERVYGIVEKLRKHNILLDAEDVFKLSQKGTVGRLHIARVMLKEGYINTIYEAFQKYIGNKGSCYVGRFKMKPQEVIELVLASGGIPVLAHPNDLGDDAWIPKLVDYGLKGIEAYYLEHSKAITDKYLNIAKKYNLLVTGGSDCHGFAKEQVRIGKMKIPYELVEKLKDAQSRI